MELVDGVDFLDCRGRARPKAGPACRDPRSASERLARERSASSPRGVAALHDAGQAPPRHQAVQRAGDARGPGRPARLRAGRPSWSRPGAHQSTERQDRRHGRLHGARAGGGRGAGAPASDWYSVGVMLYRGADRPAAVRGQQARRVLLAKQTADPRRPATLVADVPDDLDALCVDLLRRDPASRPDGRRGAPRGSAGGPGAAARCSPEPAGTGPARRPERHLGPLARGVRGGRARAGRSSVSSTAARGRARRPGPAVPRRAGRARRGGRPLGPLLRAGVGPVQGARQPDRRPEPLPQAARRHEAEALLPPRRRGRWRGSSRSSAGSRRRRGPAARRRDRPTSRSCAGGPSPPCASCSRGSATAGRWSWRSTTSSGATPTAPRCSPTCSARPTRRLLLLGLPERGRRRRSPCLRDPAGRGRGGPARDRRELVVEPLTVAEAAALALALLGPDDPAATARRRDDRPRVGGQPVLRLRAGPVPPGGGRPRRRAGRRPARSSLDEVLWRRIGRLPDEARRLLEVVAVAGRPLRQAVACRAAGLGEPTGRVAGRRSARAT